MVDKTIPTNPDPDVKPLVLDTPEVKSDLVDESVPHAPGLWPDDPKGIPADSDSSPEAIARFQEIQRIQQDGGDPFAGGSTDGDAAKPVSPPEYHPPRQT